jgi:class 3 adenylate cyclase/tetratricopeptide (TPR) repeat protein
MPTRTRTYHPQAGTPSSAGSPDDGIGGDGEQRSGPRLGRRRAGGAAGRRGDRPDGRAVDEGLVIVLFTDVEGSTELSTGRGDGAARDLLRIHEELVRTQVAGHQGRIKGWRGDGFLVTFTSARRALAAAVGIQRALEAHAAWAPHEHVRVRVGLNAGEVTEEEGELYGAAVNAAARICAQARGGEILTASVVKELAGTVPGIAFADRGWTRLRGFPEDTHLHEVTWHRERSGGSELVRTQLVGREVEMAALRGLVETALGGHGALVMLGGEQGVGKSRLAEEVVGAAARRGMLALTGHCQETGGAPPHAPFVEIIEAATRTVPGDRLRTALGDDAAEVAKVAPELHRLFPDIPPPVTLPAEHERRYLFNSVRDFFQRASRLRPLLLVLEDLHWADEATLALLCHLVERVQDMPMLLLGTYRDVEVGVGHRLADTLDLLLRGHRCHHIVVRRLREAEVAAMIRALTGQDPPGRILDAIHMETDGNPLFIEEMVRYLIDEGRLIDAGGHLKPEVMIGDLDVPDRVRLVIGRRLARLREDTRRVLTAAAIIGRGVGVTLLEAVSEVDGEAWLDAVDEAENARLIHPGDDGGSARYHFVHELIRQTLLAETSLARRQRLHLRAAEAMESATPHPDAHVVEIAHHLLLAGPLADWRKTVWYLSLAADRAMAAAAFQDALGCALTALDLLPDGHHHVERAAVLDRLARALRSLGRWDEALERWRQELAVYEELGDGESVGRLSGEMAQQLTWSGRFLHSLEAVGRGLSALGKRSSPCRAQLLTLSGVSLSFSGHHDSGNSLTAQAVGLAEGSGAEMLGAALMGRCVHHWCWGELREAVMAGTRGAEVCRSAGDLWYLANGLSFLQLALTTLGRLDDAARIDDELQSISSRLGHHGALLVAGVARSSLQAVAGNLQGFEGVALDDLAVCGRTGMPWCTDAHIRLGVVAFWRGHWDQALEQFEEAVRRQLPGTVLEGGDGAFHLLCRAYRGERQHVVAAFREQQGALLEPYEHRRLGAWMSLLVLPEALAVVGARMEAAALYPIVLAAIQGGAVLRLYDAALIQAVAGICAAASESWVVAEEHYRTSLLQAEQLPHRVAQPEVRRWFAQMLLSRDAAGDRDEARRLLGEAVTAYRRLGMPRHVEMAEALLGETEGRRRGSRDHEAWAAASSAGHLAGGTGGDRGDPADP